MHGGASDAEVKFALAVSPARALSKDLWDDLQNRFGEFSEGVQEGHMLAQAWWTRQGRWGAIPIRRREVQRADLHLFDQRIIGNEEGRKI
jgi:hypothetical protein